jgi:S1-C subfamily serine protease
MPRTGRVPAVPTNPDATQGYETREGQWMIPNDEAERVAESAREILDQVELESYTDPSGRPAGIQIQHVEDDSIVLQRGFESGDIIQRVNGQPINSKSELIDWVSKNHEKYRNFRVELQRRGQRKYLSFTIQGERR